MKVLDLALWVCGGQVSMNQTNKANNKRIESGWAHVSLCTKLFSSWEENLSSVHLKNSDIKIQPDLLYRGQINHEQGFKYYLNLCEIISILFRLNKKHYLPVGWTVNIL